MSAFEEYGPLLHLQIICGAANIGVPLKVKLIIYFLWVNADWSFTNASLIDSYQSIVALFCKSKISDFRNTILDKDVLRLNVSVNDIIFRETLVVALHYHVEDIDNLRLSEGISVLSNVLI